MWASGCVNLFILIVMEKKTDFQIGDMITHADYPDFQGRIVTRDGEKVKVMVIEGWKGKTLPTWAVPIPLAKVRRV